MNSKLRIKTKNMKAIRIHEFGGTEKLTADEIEQDIQRERSQMSETINNLQKKFSVEAIVNDEDKTIVKAHCGSDFSLCPACGAASRSVHSRYRRCIADLPLSGKMVQLLIVARRFRCRAATCSSRPTARRPAWLDSLR